MATVWYTANGNAALRRSNGVLRGGKSFWRRQPDDGVGTHTHCNGTLVSVRTAGALDRRRDLFISTQRRRAIKEGLCCVTTAIVTAVP